MSSGRGAELPAPEPAGPHGSEGSQDCLSSAQPKAVYEQQVTGALSRDCHGPEPIRDCREDVGADDSGLSDGTPVARCCSRCGAEAPAGANRCPACKSFVVGNAERRTHGLYARSLPDDLRQSVEDWRAAVVSAQGGLDVLDAEPIRAGLLRALVSVDTTERLIIAGILRAGGVDTRAGQRLAGLLLAAVDRRLRLSTTLGLDRRQKDAGSLSEWIAAHAGDKPQSEQP